jgi:peptide alpha-N-acetyltransferase
MLAVSSSYRNQGIATTLVRRAIDAMIERGADEIVLETEVTNTPAMKLYERLGFLRSKKLHRYYLNGNTAYRLVLQLKSGLGRAPLGEVECLLDDSKQGEDSPEDPRLMAGRNAS